MIVIKKIDILCFSIIFLDKSQTLSRVISPVFSSFGILTPMFKSLHWRQQITSLYYCIFFTVLPRSHASDFFENSYKITLVIKVKPSTDI